jgi:hypothetical protein
MFTSAPQATVRACSYFGVQLLAVRVKATFRIYAKTTVARVRAVCHLTPMKTVNSACDRDYRAAIAMQRRKSTLTGQ